MRSRYDPLVTQCDVGSVCNFYPTCNMCPYFAHAIKIRDTDRHRHSKLHADIGLVYSGEKKE